MDNTPLKFPRRRTRTISFRVSEREFELLKLKSEAEGARSISDLARLVLCASAVGSSDRIDKSLGELAGEVRQLSADVRRATELIEASRRSVPERPRLSPQIALTSRKSSRGV
jgi:hypothetical protein